MAEIYTNQVRNHVSSPDNMKEANIGLLCYSKPSAGLIILREQVLRAGVLDLLSALCWSVGHTSNSR
jgi:hypothetical protein